MKDKKLWNWKNGEKKSISEGVKKHIQMVTPGLLAFLHLNIPSCLTSTPSS